MTDEADLSVTVARLQRRLERERASRVEAEAIAERGLRELYVGQQRLKLFGVIATVSNGDAPVAEALDCAIREICAYTGWRVGHAWLRDDAEGADRLLPTPIWCGADDHRFDEFRALSDGKAFVRGVGLPGRVLETGAPVWLTDLSIEPNFPRAPAAIAAGLRAAFAFPVLVGPQVGAVLEFFSHEPQARDEHLIATMAQIGAQLGRVIERRTAEERQTEAHLELTRMVLEAEAQRRAAEAANRAKSDFLAVTSHEVRTPLNAVLGLAHALRQEALTERQRDLVEGVVDAGAILLRLLNAVLDLSKIEAGKMALTLAPFDLGHTAETIVRVWRSKAEEFGVSLVLDLDPRAAGHFMGDEGKVEQTLANLVSNAVKFSPPGSEVQIRISANVSGERATIRVEVADQGPGVPEEDRARIFLPFEQSGAGSATGGTGLGLAICTGNVELLGGSIGVEPGERGGAVFWFEFPATPAAAPAPAPEPAKLTDADRPLRILAAEDHPANRRVLQALLEPAGVALTLVNDGAQAVSAVMREPFDILLMDVKMPVMDGVTAVQAIRAMGGELATRPIYMLTANAFDEDVAAYKAAGADGVLKKPIQVGELYRTLQLVCEGLASAA